MDTTISVITLLNDNWGFKLMGMVNGCSCIASIHWGMAAGHWSELRGGCFWEVYFYVEINQGHLVWLLLPSGWLLFGGGVNRSFTLYFFPPSMAPPHRS